MSTILLVEDEWLVAEDLRQALAERGHEVVVTHSASEAYSKLKPEPRSFAAIVTGVDLGKGATGAVLVRRARQLNPAIKVAFMTGDPARLAVDRATEALISCKPVDADDLAAQLGELIGD